MTLPLLHCPHAETCGGCTRIAEPYDAQLAFKHQRVALTLARYPDLASIPIDPVEPAAPTEQYRTRAKLVVAPGPSVGLYARGGGHHVVDIPECRVLRPAVARAVATMRELLRDPPPDAGAALRPAGERGGALRALDVREVIEREGEGEAGVLVTLVLAREARLGEDELRRAGSRVLSRVPGARSVAASFHDGQSPQLLGTDVRVLAGAFSARDRVGAGSAYQLAAHGSFVQAHRGQAEKIHARIVAALGDVRGRSVLDLYAGSGALGLGLAAAGARATMVESYAPAVEQAAYAAREQGLTRARAIAGDAARVARELCERGERFDVVVVNPPRRGVSPEVRVAAAALAPALLAYVSCDPETLARDLSHFALLGYAAERVAPFDMIPHTDEVETLALLRPAPAPAPRVVYEDEEILVADKPPHEPVSPRAGAPGSLLARVRALPGCAGAVALGELDAGASGLCVFVKREGAAGAWRTALAAEGARREYTALVRGVARDKGAVARPLPGAPGARTRYKRTRVVAGHTLARVVAEPGVPGQARRHLAAIGHPVLGDEKAGHAPSNRHALERYGLERPFLHASRVACVHPGTGAAMSWESALPGDLASVLGRMERCAPSPAV